MQLVFRTLAAFLAYTGCQISSVAFAANVVCTVSAYDAYQLASKTSYRNRKIQFRCTSDGPDNNRFTAIANKGLTCTADRQKKGQQTQSWNARFFATPGTAINPANGWNIVRSKITGGDVITRRRSRRDALVQFTFRNGLKNNQRVLRSITITKEIGDCSNALAEAFDWND